MSKQDKPITVGIDQGHDGYLDDWSVCVSKAGQQTYSLNYGFHGPEAEYDAAFAAVSLGNLLQSLGHVVVYPAKGESKAMDNAQRNALSLECERSGCLLEGVSATTKEV